jgi:hypothetical protein
MRLPLAGARKRQGEACTQVLAPLLESQDNPGDLAALGEWIVTCDTYVFPYLRQRHLCLGQPEGHLHGPVQLDGRAQGSPGLLCSSHLAIQRAETAVAVGLERTHAQCLGQGERLLVVRFSLLGLRRLSLRCNLAKEPQGVGFVTPRLMGPRELQGTLRLSARLVQPTGAQIRLAQPNPQAHIAHEMHSDVLLNRLLQQRQGLGSPSGERIGRPQECSDPRDSEPEVHSLRQVESPFEHRDSLCKISLSQRPKAHATIRHDTAIGMIGSFGNPHPFLCKNSPLGEDAALDKTGGKVTVGLHRCQSSQTEALLQQCAVEIRHILAVALHRLVIVPPVTIGVSQIVPRHNREANISQSRSNSHGALAKLEGAVQFSCRYKMDDQVSSDPPQTMCVAQSLGKGSAIPAEPPSPGIPGSAALAFRKHRCENTP